jgi:hypothetical protein
MYSMVILKLLLDSLYLPWFKSYTRAGWASLVRNPAVIVYNVVYIERYSTTSSKMIKKWNW